MFVFKSFLALYFSQLGQLLLAIILLEYFLQEFVAYLASSREIIYFFQ